MLLLVRTVCGICLCLLLGCNGTQDGPKRYEVSGVVTYGGEPIPAGTIFFEPDSDQGNNGPGSSAEISKGTFRTRPQKGVVGGAYRARIQGYDGVTVTLNDGTSSGLGKELFPEHLLYLEFPSETSTQNLDVPKQSPQKRKSTNDAN